MYIQLYIYIYIYITSLPHVAIVCRMSPTFSCESSLGGIAALHFCDVEC